MSPRVCGVNPAFSIYCAACNSQPSAVDVGRCPAVVVFGARLAVASPARGKVERWPRLVTGASRSGRRRKMSELTEGAGGSALCRHPTSAAECGSRRDGGDRIVLPTSSAQQSSLSLACRARALTSAYHIALHAVCHTVALISDSRRRPRRTLRTFSAAAATRCSAAHMISYLFTAPRVTFSGTELIIAVI